MIGMITRQGRRVQYALMKIANEFPALKTLCDVTSLTIAKAIQDTIDGLKHDENDTKGAAALYRFLRDICELDWNGKKARQNRARIYRNLELSSLNPNLKAIVPLLKETIEQNKVALAWLFGEQKPAGVSLAKAFIDFKNAFPKLAQAYL